MIYIPYKNLSTKNHIDLSTTSVPNLFFSAFNAMQSSCSIVQFYANWTRDSGVIIKNGIPTPSWVTKHTRISFEAKGSSTNWDQILARAVIRGDIQILIITYSSYLGKRTMEAPVLVIRLHLVPLFSKSGQISPCMFD